MRDHIPHDGCSASIEKDLKAALWKTFAGEVESFYFHPDTQPQPHSDAGKKKGAKQHVLDVVSEDNVNMRHRVYVTFVLPCPKKVRVRNDYDDSEGFFSDDMYPTQNDDDISMDEVEIEHGASMEPMNKELAISAMIDEAIKTLINEEVRNESGFAGTVNTTEEAGNIDGNMGQVGVACTAKSNETVVVSKKRKNEEHAVDKNKNDKKDETVGVVKTDKPTNGPGNSNATSRCRKTNPLVLKPSGNSPGKLSDQDNFEVVQISIPPLVAAASKSMTIIKSEPVKKDVIPAGYTYEQWILHEGLHKARKLGLHRTSDKNFFPFTCPLCNKKYRNPNGIKYHAKYAHGPKSIFPCDMCEKTYATRHGLAAHKRAHEAAKIEKELELEREKIRNQKIRPAIQPIPLMVQSQPEPWILKLEGSDSIQQHQLRSNSNVSMINLPAPDGGASIFMTAIKQEILDDIED